MARLNIGSMYTREQISAIVGGGLQSFLPTKNGQVVCGCFQLAVNPDAPREVLVGAGPLRERVATWTVLQENPIPVFVKREVGEWEYMGRWRGVRYLDGTHKSLVEEERTKRKGIAGILYMEPVETV
jgi:hypothetical protein